MARVISWDKETSSTAHEDCSTASFKDDIHAILDKLDKAKIPEPLIIEFRHKYPCNVVKVMIPTLEGYFNHHIQYGGRV
jgi:hypothetical protein